MHKLRLYGFLVGLMVAVLLTCDCLAFKVINIYGFNFSASGLIFPLSFLLACVVTEAYGFKLAGRIIWIQLASQFFFILTVNVFVLLPSPMSDPVTDLYFDLYSHIWRVVFASSLAVFASYFINDFMISKLKIYLNGHLFFLRFLISNAIGNAILVSVSYPINFYSLFPLTDIVHIALNTWSYKMVCTIFLFPIALYLSNLVKRIEQIDYYDYGVSYNPISVFSMSATGKNHYASINS